MNVFRGVRPVRGMFWGVLSVFRGVPDLFLVLQTPLIYCDILPYENLHNNRKKKSLYNFNRKSTPLIIALSSDQEIY